MKNWIFPALLVGGIGLWYYMRNKKAPALAPTVIPQTTGSIPAAPISIQPVAIPPAPEYNPFSPANNPFFTAPNPALQVTTLMGGNPLGS